MLIRANRKLVGEAVVHALVGVVLFCGLGDGLFAKVGHEPSVPLAEPQGAVRAADQSVLPHEYQSFKDPQGSGVALRGMLTGNVTSARAVLLAFLENQQSSGPSGQARIFDAAPVLETVLADDSGQRAQALFSAKVNGAPVTGDASVDLSESGGTLSILYDRVQSFGDSFSRLRQSLAPGEQVRAAEVPLVPWKLGDGSSISIPQNWTIANQGPGFVELHGPNGEAIVLGLHVGVWTRGPQGYVLVAPCCDPARAFEILFPQIAAGIVKTGGPAQQLVRIIEVKPASYSGPGQAAYILYESTIAGRPTMTLALVIAGQAYSDPWMFYFSGVQAPKELFEQELPMMLEVWKSWRATPNVPLKSPDPTGQSLEPIVKAMQPSIAESSRTSLGVSPAWDQVLQGVPSPNTTKSGMRPVVDTAKSQKLLNQLTAQTGARWHVVPLSEMEIKH